MPIAAAAYSPWLFWDGRKDNLWSQALGPLKDAVEPGGDRTRVAAVPHHHGQVESEARLGPPSTACAGSSAKAGARRATTDRCAPARISTPRLCRLETRRNPTAAPSRSDAQGAA